MEHDRSDGLEVSLGDLAFALSEAIDLISPKVANHHVRVARIARAVARQHGFSGPRMLDLLLAAALHDSGALSLSERLEIMQFEVADAGSHAEAGYRLLRAFPHFETAAEIVRSHHCPWNKRRDREVAAPFASHVLHLADRVSVLPIDWSVTRGPAGDEVLAVTERSGTRFAPEIVEAFLEAAAQPGFREEVAAPGDSDLRDDSAFAAATLTEADLRCLARLFWQLVDYRSRFTATHTSGVAAVAAYVASLAGITGAAGRKVAIAAALHDIGKLAVPSETLEKERTLSREEYGSLQSHPLYGWRVLERIQGMEEINAWASYHHERLDGSGYPFHLKAGQIPLESRIVSASDVFTALTEERPYRRGRSAREAIDIMTGMAADGGLDGDLIALIGRNREELATVRRLAQQGAAGRYLAFRQHASSPVLEEAAA